MDSKKIISSIIGAAALLGGEAMAQTSVTSTTSDAMVVSYNTDTKVAHMRDLKTGETVETLPMEHIIPGAMVLFDKVEGNKGVVIAISQMEGTSTGFWHS
jgi:hypothetical protein